MIYFTIFFTIYALVIKFNYAETHIIIYTFFDESNYLFARKRTIYIQQKIELIISP